MAPTEVMEQITQVWHILESKTSWSLRRSLSDHSVHPPQPRESQLVNPTPNDDVPPPTALPSMPPPSPTSAQSSAPPPHPSTASLSLAPRPAPPQVLYESSGSSLYSPSSSFLAHSPTPPPAPGLSVTAAGGGRHPSLLLLPSLGDMGAPTLPCPRFLLIPSTSSAPLLSPLPLLTHQCPAPQSVTPPPLTRAI